MKVSFVQTEWHRIPLAEVAGSERASVPKPSFYGNFYQRLSLSSGPEQRWIEEKRALAKWVYDEVIAKLDSRDGPRVLSLGAGLGVMEEVWIARGCDVSVQECQPYSLQDFQARNPTVPVYIGDARSVEAPAGSFDVVVLCGIESLFIDEGYLALLQETSRLLTPSGLAIMISPANLTLRGLVGNTARRARAKLSPTERKRDVRWGWRRTASEHLRLGKRANLQPLDVFAFQRDTWRRLPPKGSHASLLAWSSTTIAVVWQRDGSEQG